MPDQSFPFHKLKKKLKGDLSHDLSHKILYATDASIYRELPAAVALPLNRKDLTAILEFCKIHGLPIIPRTAGTSLAGQVVGHGLVVDLSKMNQIIELNVEEQWVKVEPGVILDELNLFLKPHGLFFGPETSTGNRCMIGGMVGNNACGAHSLVYGSTRDHTLEIEALLCDGSLARFGPTKPEAFREKCAGNTLENKLYSHIFQLLSSRQNREEILHHYPDPEIHRRNTGYALDILLNSGVFDGEKDFNFSHLLCGSEGTLALYTEIKLHLVPLPPPKKALVCVHLKSITQALKANIVALQHQPVAVELIDKVILDCTRNNLAHAKNRFFLQGDPGAIMVVEFAGHTTEALEKQAREMEADLRRNNLGTHFPFLTGSDITKVWALRKAGLGLLSNLPGDAKPVAVIEDAAVHVEALPGFIEEVQQLLAALKLECVYYAHIGSGELHLRPILNLKNQEDVDKLYQVAKGMALLVKKHKGSLSGEHGDGRLRGAFIPEFYGETILSMFQALKELWDPKGLFNPGKILNVPPMKTFLRYEPNQETRQITTYFRYQDNQGFLRAVERCNGSGDCRKTLNAGGVMCPSYQATGNEFDSTRGRANLIREFITRSTEKNPFNHKELMEVLDLCLSCKGCKSECPSSVDMGKYKAEVTQHYYNTNGIPFKTRLVGAYAQINNLGQHLPSLYNFFVENAWTSKAIKTLLGFSRQRKLPVLQKQSLRKWADRHLPLLNQIRKSEKKVYLFCDEFTNHNDVHIGIQTIELLHHMGFWVEIPPSKESGRASMSKGLLKKAKRYAENNVRMLSPMISENTPLLGIEPSTILSFRDEYPDLVDESLRDSALNLRQNTFCVEEFIARQTDSSQWEKALFGRQTTRVLFHSHCHQKALSSTSFTAQALKNTGYIHVEEIQCGCCGMAGSFGFEKNHYEVSMQIGEQALFPAIRAAGQNALIVASGTSCRQQILDGTGVKALHPVEAMHRALQSEDQKYR